MEPPLPVAADWAFTVRLTPQKLCTGPGPSREPGPALELGDGDSSHLPNTCTPGQAVGFSACMGLHFLGRYLKLKSRCSTHRCAHHALWVSDEHEVLFPV